MAFRSMNDYVEQKYENLFTLTNDKDYADVIFLYRSTADVMIVKSHYITSSQYSGYVQCLETPDCPGCTYVTPKGNHLRADDKLFIPLYVITYSSGRQARQIHFWDRNVSFQNVLASQVFSNYPNPSEYLFRIIRHGVYRDPETRYEIQVIGENKFASYDQICKDNNITFPDHFETICKGVSKAEMAQMLSSTPTEGTPSSYTSADYTPVPRIDPNAAPTPRVDIPAYTPESIPGSTSANFEAAAPAPAVSIPTPTLPEALGSDLPGTSIESLNSEDVDF